MQVRQFQGLRCLLEFVAKVAKGGDMISFLFRCWLGAIFRGYLVLAAAEPEQNVL